jgi:hypothetical protein
MANEEIKERLSLETELNNVLAEQQQAFERGNYEQIKGNKTVQDRVGLLQDAVAAGKDNKKLGKIQQDLVIKQNVYAKLGNKILAKKYQNAAQAVTKQIEENKVGEENVKIQEKLTKERLKQIDNMNKMVTSGLTIFGLSGGILAVFTKFNAMTAEIGKNFGALGMQNKEFKTDILEAGAAAASLGQDIKAVAEVSTQLSKNFGFGRDESVGMAEGILDTSMALGLSNQEGTTLIGNLMQISGLSFEAAQNFSKQTQLLAEAEGVAPQQVLRDIAASSKTIAEFTAMTPENLAKAAIQATKLGTTLDTIAGSMKGMLNFQDSLNAEIEASIMLGRNVNLQKARELALAGKAEEFAVELTKQVGSQAEFERMTVLERQSLAKALGISVDQMAKMVRNQDKVRTIGEAISQQEGLEKMIGRNAMDQMAQIVADLKRVGAELVISIGPTIAAIASGFAGFTKSLSESKILIPAITILLGAMLGKSILNFAFSIATMLGKQAAFMGPMGMGLILGIPAIVGGLIGTLSSFQDLPIGKGANVKSGAALFHEGETVVNDVDLAQLANAGGGRTDTKKLEQQNMEMKQEMAKLREDMASYFGTGGSAIRGITGGFQETVQNA